MTNRLNEWLTATNTKKTDFAAAIGVVPSYVTLLCSDKPAWPGRDVAERIRAATKGEITPNDFLPPDAAPEPADGTPAPRSASPGVSA